MKHEIENQKEKYRFLAEYSNDVIWTLGLNGKFQYVSPSVERLRGYTPEEVISEPLEKALTPRSYAIVKDLINRFEEILNENPGSVPSVVTEMEQTCKDGSTVWTEASVATILGDDGKPKLFLGVSRNISDRKKRDTELKRSEENYRLLAETSMDIILLSDMEGYITYANAAFLKLSSYSSEEITSLNVQDIVLPKYHHLLEEHRTKRREGNLSKFLYEIEIKTKDNQIIPIEVASNPIHLNKLPVAVLITGRDITERKIAHAKLVENERRFRRYIENAPLPVFLVSSSGRIKFINEAASAYLGFEKSNMLGKSMFKFTAQSEDMKTRRILKEDNVGMNFELKLISSSGEEFISIIRSSRIEKNTFLIYIIDITARKKAEQKTLEKEAEIRKMNLELEEIVKSRTSELQKTNKDLEAFTYSVSHDLRAPLSHMKAFTKLLQNRISNYNDAKSENYLSTLIQSVEKMNKMIDDFLLFSKINKLVLDKSEFDMTKLVNQVIYEFNYETDKRKIDWEIEEMGNVFADKNMIRLVWVNLISNALKYSSGKEKAKIVIGKLIDVEKTAFSIKDNGAGFNENYKDKLFNVFQRLHSDSEFPGTGIGLANVKRIIESHGGEVWGASPAEEGAEFGFTLPLRLP